MRGKWRGPRDAATLGALLISSRLRGWLRGAPAGKKEDDPCSGSAEADVHHRDGSAGLIPILQPFPSL
jgi:hypothetical protein